MARKSLKLDSEGDDVFIIQSSRTEWLKYVNGQLYDKYEEVDRNDSLIVLFNHDKKKLFLSLYSHRVLAAASSGTGEHVKSLFSNLTDRASDDQDSGRSADKEDKWDVVWKSDYYNKYLYRASKCVLIQQYNERVQSYFNVIQYYESSSPKQDDEDDVDEYDSKSSQGYLVLESYGILYKLDHRGLAIAGGKNVKHLKNKVIDIGEWFNLDNRPFSHYFTQCNYRQLP